MEKGQKVRVCRFRDRVSPDLVKRLGQYGVIQEYKVLDGKGIGVVVQFDDKFTTWFFEDEVEAAR